MLPHPIYALSSCIRNLVHHIAHNIQNQNFGLPSTKKLSEISIKKSRNKIFVITPRLEFVITPRLEFRSMISKCC